MLSSLIAGDWLRRQQKNIPRQPRIFPLKSGNTIPKRKIMVKRCHMKE